MGNAYLEGYQIGSNERARARQQALLEEIQRGELALKQAAEARAQAEASRNEFFGPFQGIEKSPLGGAVASDLGELQRSYDIRKRGAFAEDDLPPGASGPPAPDTRRSLDAQDQYTRRSIEKKISDLLWGRATGAAEIRAGAQRDTAAESARAKIGAARIAAAAAGQKTEAPTGKDLHKESSKFYDDYNAGKQRTSTALGLSEAMKFRVAELAALPESVDFQMTPQEVTEFYTRLASMLGSGGGGGQVAHSLVKEIAPNALSLDLTRAQQYLLSLPQTDPNATAWAKRGMRTLARMDAAADKQWKTTVRQGAIGHRSALQADEANFRDWAKGRFSEAEIDEMLGRAGAPGGAAPAAGGGSAAGGGRRAQVKMIDVTGALGQKGKAYWLDANEAQEAELNGWQRATVPTR